jgi:phosphate-selective porin OprO and OprP
MRNLMGPSTRHLFFVLALLLSGNTFLYAQVLAEDPESGAAAVQPSSSSPKISSPSPVSFRRDGLWFSTEDEGTQLHVHGYVQGDDRMFSSNVHGQELDTFLFRRIRPLFEGTLFRAVDYRFMPDFGQSNSQIQEAFLELKSLPFAKLRVGKFKEPVGLEVLKADRDLIFAERSMASDLVPLRYIGAQIGGSVISETINYAAGYFNGSSDGSNGAFTQWARGNEASARLFIRPFASTGVSTMRQFGIGVAGSAGDQHGVIPGLKTVGQNTFFKYSSTALANGQHNRISPQAYFYAGPLGLISEYVISSQQVINKSHTGRIRNDAWQATGSVMLTGEKNSYSGIRPRNSFEPNRGLRHFGAVELAARYSQVRIDGDAFPLFANPKTAAQQAGEVGIGVNWYLNRYVKLVTDYEHTTFRMASKTVTPLHNENVLMSRIQLAF